MDDIDDSSTNWGYCHSSCPIDPTSIPIAPCPTISGAECSFPFVFEGQTWTGCTTVDEPADNPQPWCVTQTDSAGFPIDNGDGNFDDWDYCQPSCPIEQGLTSLAPQQELFTLLVCYHQQKTNFRRMISNFKCPAGLTSLHRGPLLSSSLDSQLINLFNKSMVERLRGMR